MKSIAIIGGGATGVIAALTLLEADCGKVTIFEPSFELGAGLAYGGRTEEHLLNVPAERMGWSPHNPADFLNWLAKERPEALQAPHFPFVPRYLFRLYLQARLGGRAEHIVAPVSEIFVDQGRWAVRAQSWTARFDAVVIATGYHRDAAPAVEMSMEGDAVIFGSGLTAIDHWRHLRAKGFGGTIHFVSRRGLFPLPHAVSVAPSLGVLQGLSPRRLFAELRMSGGAWPALADLVRAEAPALWKNWTAFERASFLRHLKPYWEVARHRLPATIHDELQAELVAGRAQIHRGRLIRAENDQVLIRSGASEKILSANNILYATGVRINTKSLKVSGVLPNEFGYRENPAPNLFVAGPASRAEHWEITAVPEIRGQCARLASKIATSSFAEKAVPDMPGQT